jgi:hypothetical protein
VCGSGQDAEKKPLFFKDVLTGHSAVSIILDFLHILQKSEFVSWAICANSDSHHILSLKKNVHFGAPICVVNGNLDHLFNLNHILDFVST